MLASGSPHYVMKRAAAEEAPQASKKQTVNPKAVGDLSHYRVDWSMQTCGEDYHMGGYDFKRSNVKGKLMFTYSEDGYEEDGTQVGFIEVTQYRMGYLVNNDIDMLMLFDETSQGYELYEAVVKDQEFDLSGDLQHVERMGVDPAHRGLGLGLFMIEAADHVINGQMSTQVIKPFPLQFEGGPGKNDYGFAPPPTDGSRGSALAAARAKIRDHYGKLGFKLVENTEFMLRSNVYCTPSLRQAMAQRSLE